MTVSDERCLRFNLRYHAVKISTAAIFIVVFSLLMTPQVSAQKKLFLNKGTPGTADGSPTDITNVTIDVGDIISIDVWYDILTTENVNGVSTYITFDSTIFELVDQDALMSGIQPFVESSGWSAFSQWWANETEDHENLIPKAQFVGHAQLFSGTVTGSGRFGRFELKALKSAVGAVVSVDYDAANHRDSRMFFLDNTSQKFDYYEGMTITVSGTTGIEDEPGAFSPNEYTLNQNYPNPFNPETSISFHIAKPSSVVLKVYDLTGAEVRTLAAGRLAAGRHIYTWNSTDNYGRRVSSGVYIYRLRAGEFTAVRKMILVK